MPEWKQRMVCEDLKVTVPSRNKHAFPGSYREPADNARCDEKVADESGEHGLCFEQIRPAVKVGRVCKVGIEHACLWPLVR
jgi:hypothetical protein